MFGVGGWVIFAVKNDAGVEVGGRVEGFLEV